MLQLGCLLLSLGYARAVNAAPLSLSGSWSRADPGFVYAKSASLPAASLTPVPQLGRTGGRYFFQGQLRVARAGTHVVDFGSSSVIGHFRHYLFDAEGKLVAERVGGIQSREPNPFFLRHGREVALLVGEYRLVTELESPFLLGQPVPIVEELAPYRQAIKPGNALTLLCLGLFVGLGVYYAVLACWRRRMADATYAFFILGNLLYNGSALLVFSDLFGMHWFYLVSVPILFSNVSYVLFVVALLEIWPRSQPRLHRAARALVLLLSSFVLVAAVRPNWSLELDRIGVAVFVGFGLVAALLRARQGSRSAQLYLGTIFVFGVLAISAISLNRLDGHLLYIEHLGLFAVALEVSLLGLVLAHQFALLYSERDTALRHADENIRLAHSDALTGLPNRHRLELELLKLPEQGSLTFIDLDGLKHYNDQHGHQRGDELLCCFARHLTQHIAEQGLVYRLSGDEFAITCPSGDVDAVAQRLNAALDSVRSDGFELAGASAGSVHVDENPTRDRLKHLADTRMYTQKRERRKRQSLAPRPAGGV